MSSEVKGLLSNSSAAATVAVAGDGTCAASGDESSGSNYGTVLQDSMVMCAVPSDSDTESSTGDEISRRRLVRTSARGTTEDTSSPHSTTCVLLLLLPKTFYF